MLRRGAADAAATVRGPAASLDVAGAGELTIGQAARDPSLTRRVVAAINCLVEDDVINLFNTSYGCDALHYGR